jgi:hypothetical protein
VPTPEQDYQIFNRTIHAEALFGLQAIAAREQLLLFVTFGPDSAFFLKKFSRVLQTQMSM